MDRQKRNEQQSEVIYLCSGPRQHDETVGFSSNVWYLRAAGVLLTNNQAAAFTAQHVILEPFRENAGAHSPLLSIDSGCPGD